MPDHTEREREDLRDTLLSEAIAREVRNMLRSERAAVRAAVLAEVRDVPITDATIVAVEEAVGMGNGAWDMVNATDIIRASIAAALTALEATDAR